MFKIGDKVKIKKFETVDDYMSPFPGNPGFNKDMLSISRQNVALTVSRCASISRERFRLDDTMGYTWDARWLEYAEPRQFELFD